MKTVVEDVHEKLKEAVECIDGGEMNLSEFGEYVYLNLANDILEILDNLID